MNTIDTRTAMRGPLGLVIGYVALSIATLIVVIAFRDNTSMVNSAVWVRTVVVAATSLLTLAFTRRAASGSPRAFLRLRIASAIIVIAIIVIVALPGTFPVWLKIEQAVCGLLLLGVVVQVNNGRLRSLFTS